MEEPRLILGDCLDVLPTLADGSVDAVITDPPYVVKNKVELRGKGVAPRRQRSETIGDQGWTYGKDWIREAARVCRKHIVIFGNYLDLPDLLRDWGQGEFRGIITWKKPNAALPAWNVPHYDTEFVVWFGRGRNPPNIRLLDSMVIECPFPAAGCFASERIVNATGKAVHPAQKPIKVMRRLVEAFTSPGDLVLDPFAGTATTAIVCGLTGRRFVGIERDPDYYAVASGRIAAMTTPPPLFATANSPAPSLFPDESSDAGR